MSLFFHNPLFSPSPFISTDERMPKIKSPRSVSDSPNNWSEAIGHNSTIRRCRSRRGKLAWRQGLENSSLAEPHVGELNETQEFNICFISRFLLVLFFYYFVFFSALLCLLFCENVWFILVILFYDVERIYDVLHPLYSTFFGLIFLLFNGSSICVWRKGIS